MQLEQCLERARSYLQTARLRGDPEGALAGEAERLLGEALENIRAAESVETQQRRADQVPIEEPDRIPV